MSKEYLIHLLKDLKFQKKFESSSYSGYDNLEKIQSEIRNIAANENYIPDDVEFNHIVYQNGSVAGVISFQFHSNNKNIVYITSHRFGVDDKFFDIDFSNGIQINLIENIDEYYVIKKKSDLIKFFKANNVHCFNQIDRNIKFGKI